MTKAVSIFKQAGSYFCRQAKRTVSQTLNRQPNIGESLAQGCVSNPACAAINPEAVPMQPAKTIFSRMCDKAKSLFKSLKKQPKYPTNFDLEAHNKVIEESLENYLKLYQAPKNMSAEKFKERIRNKISDFYLSEANKANSIVEKHKEALKEMHDTYSQTIKSIRSKENVKKVLADCAHDKEKAADVMLAQKQKADEEFANKFLDMLAKEYNLGNIKPPVKIKELEKNVIGGWNPVYGEIFLDSNKFMGSEQLANTLFHEFTHFRQDIDLYALVGEEGFMKHAIISSELIGKDKKVRQLVAKVGVLAIAKNPMYQKIKLFVQKHPMKKNSINQRFAKIKYIEGMSKHKGEDYQTYRNRLYERHAHYNGNLFLRLYKNMIEADIKGAFIRTK